MALEHDQQGHVLLEMAIYTGVNGLFGYHSGSVQTGSDQFCKTIPLPEPQTGPKFHFVHWPEPWTRLWSGSQKFGFKLWFRTKLQHHYIRELIGNLAFHDYLVYNCQQVFADQEGDMR